MMKISIRRKIILTFSVFLVAGAAIWSLNYYNHYLLTQKLRALEKKDALFNTILEARRFEKNYFLYLEPRYLHEARSYVQQSERRLSGIIEEFGRYIRSDEMKVKLEELRSYDEALATFLHYYEGDSLKLDRKAIEDFPLHQEAVRDLGKKITEDMERVLLEERKNVNQLLKDSEAYHMAALAGIVTLSIFTALYLLFKVNRPLRTIEDAIQKISVGDYKNVPTLATGDEFESLVDSLNNMINELNRRNEQLIHSEKMASLGTLTSGVAHELNNPLNNISTSVQILLEELGDGNLAYQKELLTDAEAQIERARDTVKALLEFSRERSFSVEPVRFKDLVLQTIQLVKSELPAAVELNVDVPDDIQVEMDPHRMQQVLINLILNGVQAIEDAGAVMIQTCHKEEDQFFSFQVKDTGKGIPPADLPRIFDPFFTTKDVGVGSGLGLSVSRGIVERHGGRIEVESQPGKGSTFRVFLPRQASSDSTSGLPEA